MALTDFFRINLPYGMNKNSKGEWMLFNREYAPIGWNKNEPAENVVHNGGNTNLPVYTKYKGLTDNIIGKRFGNGNNVKFDENGRITRIFFYPDRTNPTNNSANWDDYFESIKWLSKFQVKQ